MMDESTAIVDGPFPSEATGNTPTDTGGGNLFVLRSPVTSSPRGRPAFVASSTSSNTTPRGGPDSPNVQPLFGNEPDPQERSLLSDDSFPWVSLPLTRPLLIGSIGSPNNDASTAGSQSRSSSLVSPGGPRSRQVSATPPPAVLPVLVAGPLYVKCGSVYVLYDCKLDAGHFQAAPRVDVGALTPTLYPTVRFLMAQMVEIKLLEMHHYHDRFMFEIILEGDPQQRIACSRCRSQPHGRCPTSEDHLPPQQQHQGEGGGGALEETGSLSSSVRTAPNQRNTLPCRPSSGARTSIGRSSACSASRSRSRKFASLPKRVDGASGGSLNPCGLHSIAPDQGHAGGEGFSVLTFKAVGFNDLSHWVDEIRSAPHHESGTPTGPLPTSSPTASIVSRTGFTRSASIAQHKAKYQLPHRDSAPLELPVFGLGHYRFGKICI